MSVPGSLPGMRARSAGLLFGGHVALAGVVPAAQNTAAGAGSIERQSKYSNGPSIAASTNRRANVAVYRDRRSSLSD